MKVKEYLKIASTYLVAYDKELERRLVLEIAPDVDKRISKLSKGMMSMVTIIVALASKAEYTFLDEPVAGLDVVAREQFYKILLEKYDQSGRTFIISTHILEEAADLFEEVIIMHEGKIILKENTVELLDRARHVSGKTEVVDEAVKGMEICHAENMGRSKGVTVLMKKGQFIQENTDISVQPISLQKLFVALCGNK